MRLVQLAAFGKVRFMNRRFAVCVRGCACHLLISEFLCMFLAYSVLRLAYCVFVYCIFRLTYCVLRIPYCVVRIAYSVSRIPYSVLRIAYCVFRIAYSYCLSRIAYSVFCIPYFMGCWIGGFVGLFVCLGGVATKQGVNKCKNQDKRDPKRS